MEKQTMAAARRQCSEAFAGDEDSLTARGGGDGQLWSVLECTQVLMQRACQRKEPKAGRQGGTSPYQSGRASTVPPVLLW